MTLLGKVIVACNAGIIHAPERGVRNDFSQQKRSACPRGGLSFPKGTKDGAMVGVIVFYVFAWIVLCFVAAVISVHVEDWWEKRKKHN
jgi:hypothetical protein